MENDDLDVAYWDCTDLCGLCWGKQIVEDIFKTNTLNNSKEQRVQVVFNLLLLQNKNEHTSKE